jgi:hypothetical protein
MKISNIKLSILLYYLTSYSLSGTTYYVATSGKDSNPGTIIFPFASWQKGFESATAGDTVYIRGGIYYAPGISFHGNYYGVRVTDHDGTPEDLINILAYPGETPVLDGTSVVQNGIHVGINMDRCDYWYIKGLIVRNFKEFKSGGVVELAAAWNFEATHLTLDQCVVHECGNGFAVGDSSDYIYYKNCDAYDNVDFFDDGGLANGFAVNVSTGMHIFYDGCRAWLNSDDGWDLFDSDGYITINNCWAFENGRYYGNGVGFKLGITPGLKEEGVQRIIFNSAAWDNKGTGFDESQDYEAVVDMVLYNNTAYNNGGNGFSFQQTKGSGIITLKNNISFRNNYGDALRASCIQEANSWQNNLGVTVKDFVSINSTGVKGPRLLDGSLPVLSFLHLSAGSDMINSGVDVHMNYAGIAPDLGAFEFQPRGNAYKRFNFFFWLKRILMGYLL